MRFIILSILILSCFSALKAHAQRANPGKIIGKNDSLKLKVIRRPDNNKYYLIYKKKGKSDSLLISTSQTQWEKDTCIIKQKQLNDLGALEVIIEIIQANQLNAQSNSYFSTIQIWDVDSKMQMFNGTKKWYSEIELLSKTKLDNNFEPTVVTSICEGNYDIELRDDASLMIKNLTERAVNTDYCATDHAEGIYILFNGKYVLKK